MEKRYVVGIDIGATAIKGGLVLEQSASGNFDAKTKKASDYKAMIIQRETHLLLPSQKNEKKLLDTLVKMSKKLCVPHSIKFRDLSGIGVGIPGIVNFDKGMVVQSPNLPALTNFELRDRLREKTGLQTIVENDVNAIALGEMWRGAAKNKRDFLLLAPGTGLGGALVLNGKLWRGADGMAGEFGHINIEPDGPSCGCGSRGCLEQYASQVALIRSVKQDQFTKVLLEIEQESDIPRRLHHLASMGNQQARSYYKKMGWALGIGLAGLLNTFNVKTVLFGGGLSKAFEIFAPTMKKTIAQYAYPAIAKGVRIRKVELWEDGGIYGTAAKILEAVEDK